MNRSKRIEMGTALGGHGSKGISCKKHRRDRPSSQSSKPFLRQWMRAIGRPAGRPYNEETSLYPNHGSPAQPHERRCASWFLREFSLDPGRPRKGRNP